MAESKDKTQRKFSVNDWFRIFLYFAIVIGVVRVFARYISPVVLFTTLTVILIIILLIKHFRPVASDTLKPQVEIDSRGVRKVLGQKIVEQIQWKDLVKVSIVTTDEGPFVEDLFLLLHAKDGSGCAVPHNQACEIDLLSYLQSLPNFNNDALIKACSSVNRAEFICWKGFPGEAIEAGKTLLQSRKITPRNPHRHEIKQHIAAWDRWRYTIFIRRES